MLSGVQSRLVILARSLPPPKAPPGVDLGVDFVAADQRRRARNILKRQRRAARGLS